ncbi:hypothetical protein D3C79_967060 [compost metagenome]
MDQLTWHFLVVAAEWGACHENLLCLGEMGQGLLPTARRRMVPLIDDDQVEEVWGHPLN